MDYSFDFEYERDYDEDYNDDVNGLETYIVSNAQLSGNTNLKEFLRTHHSPPSEFGLIRRYEEHVRERMYRPQNTRHDISDYDANMELIERIGKVEIGVNDVNKVSRVLKTDALNPKVFDKACCPICQDDLAGACVAETKLRKLFCNHVYCAPCIEKWLKKNKKCPVCMKDVMENSKKN